MAQHDFTIDNQTFPATRSDINSALQALASLSSGASSPSTTFAYQLWVDTTSDPNILNIRNSANNAWIKIGEVNQSSAAFILTAYANLQAGSAAAPSFSFDLDRDTGMYRAAANIIGFATNGTERFRVGDSGQLGIGGATYGTSGQVLTSGGSAAAPSWASLTTTGRLLRAPQVLTGTSYTTPANCSFIVVLAVGGGGGGGGGSRYSGASTNGGRGGGGAATFQATIAVSPSTSYTIAIGAAGTGGAGRASSNGNGTVGVTGGTTSITVGATTYSASGGAGGAGGISNGTTQTGAAGGAATPTASLLLYCNGGTSTSGGTISGGPGGNSAGVFSGMGGSNSIAANGFGAGGEGGDGGNNANGIAGGTGIEGRLIVWEYS